MVEISARTSVPEILEKHLTSMNTEFESLTRKAQQTITVSTIIIGFATTFATFNLSQPQLSSTAKLLVLGSFVVYVFIFLLSLRASLPKPWTAYPIDPTEDNI